MQVLETIKPIINGSANPRLTLDMFKELNIKDKTNYIWSVIVSLEFAHCFPEVDNKVFEKSPNKDKWKYDDINAENADSLFIEVRNEYAAHHNKMLNKTSALHFELGKKIYAAQRELGFGGWMELTKNRMQGYITACGSWNDFNSNKVSAALAKLHEVAPRKNYGTNNPNTGSLMHKWKSVHGCEYLVMEFDFVDAKDVVTIKEFYKKHWGPIGTSIDADSIRLDETDHGQGYFGIELIMWWD